MTRQPEALIAYTESRQYWTFGYGSGPTEHDCARFCDGGVLAVTGQSPLKAFASSWTSERGARRVLVRHGGLAKAISTVMAPVPVTFAQRGDVGMTADDTLVLIEGDTVVGLSDSGQIRLPRAALTKAWTVIDG